MVATITHPPDNNRTLVVFDGAVLAAPLGGAPDCDTLSLGWSDVRLKVP
jgi:hypothetical protein